MKHGFIKCAVCAPDIVPADPGRSAGILMDTLAKTAARGVKLLLLPELCLTGSDLGGLVARPELADGAAEALIKLASYSRGLDLIAAVGLPLRVGRSLYNCTAVICDGAIIGIVPKESLSYGESRYFSKPSGIGIINIAGIETPFGANLCFSAENISGFTFAVRAGADYFNRSEPPPAPVLLNPAAFPVLAGGTASLRKKIAVRSECDGTVILHQNAGYCESTASGVYSGFGLISESGVILTETRPFEQGIAVTEIDLTRLVPDAAAGFTVTGFRLKLSHTRLTREISPYPFLNPETYAETLELMARGLAARLERTGSRAAVLAWSGGLDSALALLVSLFAAKILGWPPDRVHAVSMPCFGTTERTKNNAQKLAELLRVSFSEIDISDSVLSHFKDIGQEPDTHDLTYENAQARERTQVVMDLAGRLGGIMVGTGDMSESAIGCSTYNGDHMSMYNPNAGIPKTLVRALVSYCAGISAPEIATVLRDIIDTPISPELKPGGSQITEDMFGPYELTDFFLYHFLSGAEPARILSLARCAFGEKYSREYLTGRLKYFIDRFIRQQYKRSCAPESPSVAGFSLSPRNGYVFPGDLGSRYWTDSVSFF